MPKDCSQPSSVGNIAVIKDRKSFCADRSELSASFSKLIVHRIFSYINNDFQML